MSSEQLDAIKARAEAATEGPWRVQLDGFDYGPWDEVYVDNARGQCPCTPYGVPNAEFIAHARQDIPALAAAVEAVLELHEPEATGYGDWVCGACISAGSHDWESTAYPCPTVTAIQSALREVGK